ncbi:hypothetical protein AB0B94_31195 [Micromonospora sp. NPDC048986]|uniref:hypothetical protein n=1 Tax=Micromonospora sp. NPDC048986 TaxID=3155644 RepID=UPI003400CAE9
MALSRLAQQFADEIRNHDWSDAPYRADKAGHKREHDTSRGRHNVPQLAPEETDTIRLNVMWVTAQVLAYNDPNFDVYEFAEACGVDTTTPSGRPRSGHITAGLRGAAYPGSGYARPGSDEA